MSGTVGPALIARSQSAAPAVTIPSGVTVLDSYTAATGPVTGGSLWRATDDVRGVWTANGTIAYPLLPAVNVKDFGATGDGVTDDTAAIQAAHDAAKAAGVALLLPNGDFRVSSLTWDPDVPIIGAGVDLTRLRSNAAAVMLANTAPGVTTHAKGIIRDLTLHGNSQGTHGMVLTNLARFYIDRVIVQNFTTKGIESIGSLVLQLTRCQILSCVIGIDAYANAVNIPNFVAYRDCVVSGHTTYGIQQTGGSFLILDGCDIESNGTIGDANTGGVLITSMNAFGEGVAAVVKECWFEGNNGHSAVRVANAAAAPALHVFRDLHILAGTRNYGIYVAGANNRHAMTNIVAQNAALADLADSGVITGWVDNCVASSCSFGTTTSYLNQYPAGGITPSRHVDQLNLAGGLLVGGGDKITKAGWSATPGVADGAGITHGFGSEPTAILVTGTVAGEMVSVTAKDANAFTVAIKTHAGAAGTVQTIYWLALA